MSKAYLKYLCEEHKWENNTDYPSNEIWETIGLIQETSLNEIKNLLDGKIKWTYALSGEYLLITGTYRIFIKKGEDYDSIRKLCKKYLTAD